MSDYLLGVPGKLKRLLDRVTDTRAANLDNLNATISSRAAAADYTSFRAAKLDNLDTTVGSRAPASSALSSSVWTSARAAKLDNLDAPITSLSRGISSASPRGVLTDSLWDFSPYGTKRTSYNQDTGGVWVDAVSVTGSGVVSFVCISLGAGIVDTRVWGEVILDGYTLASLSVVKVSTPTSVLKGAVIVGQEDGAFENIPFRSSFRIRFKSEHAYNAFATSYRYYLG